MKRRSFLKSGIILSVGFPYLQSCDFTNKTDEQADKLYQLFLEPPVTSKPFVRWWWNGNRLEEKEILRQLDVMKAGGVGGVEINSIAFPGEADPMDIPSMEWLSPEWINMVKVALKGAEERGMICDIIVGSGWPFGGEFLEAEERTQLLTLSSRQVKGKGVVKWGVKDIFEQASPVIHSNYANPTKELHSAWLAPVKMDTFTPAIALPIDKNATVLEFDIPEGEYVLYVLVKVTAFQAVINGAPGAAGPVLNHFNKEAVNRLLNRMSDKLFPAIEGIKGFRAMFCDSMELEGANWCADFPEEFKARRGYDIIPYLPFILYKVGHMGQAVEGTAATELSGEAQEDIARVKYDFQTVCIELINDRFLVPYTEWCKKHNVLSRIQPYGREYHPLEASMKVDIPECETWLWNPDSRKDTDFAKNPACCNVNKFVASAAHLTGKRLVSCEEITNTGMVFNATLERVKVAGDQSNLSGVTHSILHGFNYSPERAEFPGWIRYGMYFSERNTWWPFFKQWSAYKARLSTVLQNTDFFADIAVMQPLADLWTKYGTQRDPFPALHYPTYQYKVWEAIHQNGNSCDYLSESIVQQATTADGYLTFNDRKYHTLILLKVETMLPETARALANFTQNGGKVIFVEAAPYKSPGLNNYQEQNKQVSDILASMKAANPGSVYLVEAPGDDVLGWFTGLQKQCDITPYLKIDKPSPFVSQIRHQDKQKEVYFFSNYSTDETFTMRVSFPGTNKKAWLWDMETGKRYLLAEESDHTLPLTLPPATSRLIVYEKLDAGDKYPVLPKENSTPVDLSDWDIELFHMDGTQSKPATAALTNWGADPSTQSFAGKVVYKKTQAGQPSYHYINLGKVYGVSEVSINGEELGSRWYGEHKYQIPPHLAEAKELAIQVTITTTTGNYMKFCTDNKTAQTWTRGQDWQPQGMLGPVCLL